MNTNIKLETIELDAANKRLPFIAFIDGKLFYTKGNKLVADGVNAVLSNVNGEPINLDKLKDDMMAYKKNVTLYESLANAEFVKSYEPFIKEEGVIITSTYYHYNIKDKNSSKIFDAIMRIFTEIVKDKTCV